MKIFGYIEWLFCGGRDGSEPPKKPVAMPGDPTLISTGWRERINLHW